MIELRLDPKVPEKFHEFTCFLNIRQIMHAINEGTRTSLPAGDLLRYDAIRQKHELLDHAHTHQTLLW